MVSAEDIVSYFQSLKSYERIWIMCRLQHTCVPFELRFLGTCLEELGKRDYHELRQVENEANSNAEISISELRKISNKHVQKKIILYLSLLHSHNYSCSNSLYKILCNSEEVNSLLKFNLSKDEDDCFEHLLTIYTLAVNHPAFSCEQKKVLNDIFKIIEAEENKRSSLNQSTNQPSVEHSDAPLFDNAPLQIQECQPHINTLPENTYPPHQLPNPSHLPTIPQPFTHDISIPMGEQINIGLPPPNFVRFPFPAGPWNPAIPIVFTTTEQTNTTHSFMSRSSSPSLSNSPSRSSSPAKVRPLSAPFIRSPQIAGPIPHQPTSLPLPQTNLDPFGEMINKDMPALSLNAAPHYASEQLYRLTDEELTSLGMTDESIQQLRCVVVDKRPNNEELISSHSVDTGAPNTDGEVDSIPPGRLMYSAGMVVPTNMVPNATSHPCPICHVGPNSGQINGFVSPGGIGIDMVSCIDHEMHGLQLESDAPSRNSNSSNSDATSSDQSSPPNTPMLAQNNYIKRNIKNSSNNEWSKNNANGTNGTNEEKSNAGDSSSEEKNSSIPTSYQGRGRVVSGSNRGRSKNPNTYNRGRGNHRRRNENMNGNNDEMRKSQFSVGSTDASPFQYPANPVTATVTNATYIQPHLIRSYSTFPANSYIRPPYPTFPPSGELLYHQYPPPTAFIPGPMPYPAMVSPKLSCYNCGSQNHMATDCTESTLEEATKQGQYRLDYAPVENIFTEK